MRRLISVVFILIILSKNSLSNSTESEFYVAAKVNNNIITSTELLDRYNFVIFDSGLKINNKIEKTNIINQILDKMIDEELIRQEAKKYDIKVSQDELDEAVVIVMSQKKQKVSSYKSRLIKNKISYENFLKQIYTEICWSKIASEIFASKIKITDFEINEFVEQNSLAKNYRKILLGEIFLPASSESENKILAKKLVEELRLGADFKTLVKQFSKDSFSENFGEIGWISEDGLDEKIKKNISQLKVNQYSDAIFLKDGYYIFKLIDVKNEQKIESDQINFAKNNLFLKKLQTIAKGSLNDIRKNSFIEIDRKKIRNL